MRRALFILIVLALVAAATLWVANRPASVTITAGDVLIEIPLWLAALAFAVSLLVVAVLVRLYAGMRSWLARRRLKRALSRRDEGDEAMVAAFAALAAGDGAAALKYGEKARRLLGDTPLTLMLAGYAARAAGRVEAAETTFRLLAEQDGAAAVLGQRGIAQIALERGNRAVAAEAARAALAYQPNAAWAQSLAFEDAVRRGEWQAALRLLPPAESGSEAGLRRAALLLAAAAAETEARAALRLEQQAAALAPSLAPTHAAVVRRLRAMGNARAAERALKEGLAKAPHPMLAALALEGPASETKAARAKRLSLLASEAGGAEMALAAAQAALEAEEWAEARRWAERARAGGVEDRRLHALLAKVAEGEFAGTERAHAEAEAHWRDAASAPEPPEWACTVCGASQPEWSHLCGSCGSVGSLRWGEARAASPQLLLPAPLPGL
ncbi:MAG: hypothetical protein NZ523_07255 [Elioraea sp.]|nr:hypothetical protein [Elioraea sp.]